MSYVLINPHRANFYDNLFLGIPEPGNNLSRLYAHRFEATFLKRVMGALNTSEQSRYESVFRDFLIYAGNKNLTMDWKLGLYFLDWGKKVNFVKNIKLHSLIASQAAYRWVNTSYRDLDERYIMISDFPKLPYWILGERSKHPLQPPRLFKVKPIKNFMLNDINYTIQKNISVSCLNWQSI